MACLVVAKKVVVGGVVVEEVVGEAVEAKLPAVWSCGRRSSWPRGMPLLRSDPKHLHLDGLIGSVQYKFRKVSRHCQREKLS